jgi:hypothetical protein
MVLDTTGPTKELLIESQSSMGAAEGGSERLNGTMPLPAQPISASAPDALIKPTRPPSARGLAARTADMEQPLVRAKIAAQQANLVAIQRRALEGVDLARVDGDDDDVRVAGCG